jgi:hypothetical protein
MAKKRKKRRSSLGGIKNSMSKSSLMESGLQIGEILLGVALGSQVKKFVEKKDAVSGTDLLGLDGETSKYTTPVLVCVAGGLAAMFAKNNKHLRNVALGISVAGGAGLVNAMSGKSLVALGDADDNAPIVLPGIGNVPMLPGIGNDIPDIPNNYDYSLNPALVEQPIGDIEYFEETDTENIAGIGLANII